MALTPFPISCAGVPAPACRATGIQGSRSHPTADGGSLPYGVGVPVAVPLALVATTAVCGAPTRLPRTYPSFVPEST